ncbi:Pentulose kinase [Multifurca ochricompacta]|uniref:Pentulose kinase n=1 Tax=Multifurca ochricompacta TaxID=376703 RepID=A0AAD4QLK2_9AGAM|nr:Pentulose kinase [Multifurca ochricompacta]
MASSKVSYYLGIDVGTGSARAALVNKDGTVLASASQDTKTWRDQTDHRIFEHICIAVREVISQSKVPPELVKGIGFDATCSLAVTSWEGEPITVTRGAQLGEPGERNIILWADHRAEKEAELINATGSPVLDYVGGTISLEMEIPKILWLKRFMVAKRFERCQFFDLPDFLTYRATDARTRSLCSLTCKCTYIPENGWDRAFMSQIGLDVLVQNEFIALGTDVLTAGKPVGGGLTMRAAEELGLEPGTPVGSGVIDAYAGWLGTIAARHEADGEVSPSVSLDESAHRLAAVAGTSTCHLVQSKEGVFVQGVWGPYKDAVFPSWWMNEGGQSSTGQLIDFVISTHSAHQELKNIAQNQNKNIHDALRETLEDIRLAEGAESWTEVIAHMHFYPDLHGNRSPIADSRMRGSIVGLTLDSSLHDLARKYALALEAIALQTRHIIDKLNAAGHSIRALYLSGSQAQNVALMRLLANTCNMPVVLPRSHSASVVLGAAMLGRFATIRDPADPATALWDIMQEMTPLAKVVHPVAGDKEKRLLEVKYRIFLESINLQKRWRDEIDAVLVN